MARELAFNAKATANVLFMFLNRNKVLVCPMKSAPVMLTLSDSKHVVLPVDDDSDLNVVASFDRRGEYIYTGNAKGKVSLDWDAALSILASARFLCSRCFR